MMFYGLDAPITPFSSFTTDFIKSLINVIFAPGYYLIITKGILRDTASIVNAFTNFQNDSGAFAAMTGAFLAIETILSSYTFKFLMVMAQTGAQALRYIRSPGLHHAGGRAITYDEQKKIETLSPEFHRGALSRFHGGSKPQSPLSLKLHTALFLPQNLPSGMGGNFTSDEITANVILGENLNYNLYQPNAVSDAVNRLTPEVVHAIEQKIDF